MSSPLILPAGRSSSDDSSSAGSTFEIGSTLWPCRANRSVTLIGSPAAGLKTDADVGLRRFGLARPVIMPSSPWYSAMTA